MTAAKLDIFRVLKNVDAKNADFYGKLEQDEQKAFAPFLVSRWMSGTPNPLQVYLINEFVNPYTFSLGSHKQLLWQLLTAANSGKSQRYSWNKLPARKQASKPLSTKVVMDYFAYSTKDATEALALLSSDDIVDLAEDLGYQQEDITKLKKEYKDAGDSRSTDKQKTSTKQSKAKTAELIEF